MACCSEYLRGCWAGSVCGVCGVLNFCGVELEGAVLGEFKINSRTLNMLLYENITADCLM